MSKRFYKSQERKICGVCGGIAEYFDFDPSLVRVLYTVLTLCTSLFPCIIVYIVLAFVMPDRPSAEENWDNMKRANDYTEKPADKEFNSYFKKEKKERNSAD
ncbi:MAG: PspC domain-containing protein [Treponema sp.]|nr:PspC domain-containing protein [Treponema sp.]